MSKTKRQNGDKFSTPFDRLMSGLIAVPKEELEAEIAKEKREKEQPEKPKRKK